MTRLTIPFLVPMLNGPNGLQRAHWAKIRLLRKKIYTALLTSHLDEYAIFPRSISPAKVTITRFSNRQPDDDNLVAGAKLILDEMKERYEVATRGRTKINLAHGWIVDDSPDLCSLTCRWEKAKRGQGKVVVEVEQG